MWVDEETGLTCSMRWDGEPIDDVDMLHVEHVNGGGNKERRKFGGDDSGLGKAANDSRQDYYQYIYEHLDTGNYQLLCANHHALKTAMERRQRKEAQALAKGQEQPVSDTNNYEVQNTRINKLIDFGGVDYNRDTYYLEQLEELYQHIACSLSDTSNVNFNDGT